MKPVEFTISEAQLHAVLSEIDAELRASSTKLFGRELRGWTMFCRRFKLEMASTDPLAVRIFAWFTKQYGDRLKGNLDFGNTVVEIRHDLYSLRFPRLYGEEIVHCDPLLPSTYFGPRLSKKGPLRGSLFDHLAGVTPDFVSSITVEECKNLLDVYARGFAGLSRMHDAQNAPYAKEALDDLHQSASQLTAYSPNYGFSRWASLQATEKLLKGFIALCGQTPRKSHNMADLASTATSLGLPSPPSSLLQEVQCDADVRYSAATVGKAEALRAHYAALSLCSDIAPRLRSQSDWITEIRMLSYELNGTSRPMKALLVKRLKTARGGP